MWGRCDAANSDGACEEENHLALLQYEGEAPRAGVMKFRPTAQQPTYFSPFSAAPLEPGDGWHQLVLVSVGSSGGCRSTLYVDGEQHGDSVACRSTVPITAIGCCPFATANGTVPQNLEATLTFTFYLNMLS